MTPVKPAAESVQRAISKASPVQLGLTIALCCSTTWMALSLSRMKDEAMKEIREQYVNKDLFNAKFDLISAQLATQNEKLTDLKSEVKAIHAEGGHK